MKIGQSLYHAVVTSAIAHKHKVTGNFKIIVFIAILGFRTINDRESRMTVISVFLFFKY